MNPLKSYVAHALFAAEPDPEEVPAPLEARTAVTGHRILLPAGATEGDRKPGEWIRCQDRDLRICPDAERRRQPTRDAPADEEAPR